jgi:subtilisin family serine protease
VDPIGIPTDPATDPEYIGVVTDPLNGSVDRQAGHGTFIAGIVRQHCPQAHLLAIPVMPADGAVAEQDIHTALALLLQRHLDALRTGNAQEVVDVLSLSLGYYHESPEDALSDGPLRRLIEAYAANGVAVVLAAGNDGTRMPFFPAAFAAEATAPVDPAGAVPITSVGALNPDGTTVALFSNNGDWVTTHRRGAAVVSTVPTSLQGGRQASVRVERHDPGTRSTIDPDDYSSGFAIWSGTSFAAPVVAGQLAAAIAADPSSADIGRDEAVERGRAAVNAVVHGGQA